MASLENKLSQFGDLIIYTKANQYFTQMNIKMQEAISTQLTVVKSYLSKYQVVGDLRERLNEDYRTKKFPGSAISDEDFTLIQPLLDTTKDIVEIVNNTPADYEKLAAYMDDLANNHKNAFDPPLQDPVISVTGETIQHMPAAQDIDPRRFGRVLQFETFSKEQLSWLINNAPLFGFTLYFDYALYYVGFAEIQQKVSSEGVSKVINRFQSEDTKIPDSSISLTASTIASAKDPLFGELEIATLSAPCADNDNNPFAELAVVDGQLLPIETAKACKVMQAAAKAEGINLVVGSGFRPAINGPTSITWRSPSGKKGTLYTQQRCRSEEGRWKSSHADYALITKPGGEDRVHYSSGGTGTGKYGRKTGKDAFIFYAASTAYKAQTAPPGSSNHGSGIACDFNTGSGSPSSRGLKPNGTGANYKWLTYNSFKYGFVRGVSSEEWHFEYKPAKAALGPYSICPKTDARWYPELGLNAVPGF